MTTIPIKGPVIDDSNGEFMAFFGEDSYTYPSKVKKNLASANGGDVVVEINSPGGYTGPAAEIYTDLKNYTGNVEVHIVGEADSAASFIAMAGNKVLMSPMAMMMIHRAMGSVDGNTDALASQKQALDELDENIVNAYASKTGKDKQDIYNLMSKETWMNAKTAVREGFADGVMSFDDRKDGAVAPMLNAATFVPHFDEDKMMKFKTAVAKKAEQPAVDEKNKNVDKIKLANKLDLLFGGN